ncbi:MAG TPA: HD domain-containing phosphohydrolase [Desulfosarcina sp.]|nr:HD domain-containing phosphohydrolase [Desulfosarcina sp.]
MRHLSANRKQSCEQHVLALSALSRALGRKDSYTQAHGQRVALYAMRLARRLGLDERAVRHVGIGGLLHDVGKLALSDRIFSNRDTQLSGDLRQEVHCHPLIGAALLRDIDFLEPVVDLVLFHHEREDGRGYPFGLKGGEIPPGAKMVSIADCFDAVTTNRPYQKGQSIQAAYGILREGCSRYFCAAYVETFIEDIEENGIVREQGPDPSLAEELIRSAAGCGAV